MSAQHETDSAFQTRFQILVVTDNLEAAKALSYACNRRGQDLSFCLYDGEKLRGAKKDAPDLILMVLTDYIEHAKSIKAALTAHFSQRTIPFVGALFREDRYQDLITFDLSLIHI